MGKAGRPFHAFCDDALGKDDAVGIAQRLARGDVSADEVINAAIARLKNVDPILRGLVVDDFDRARNLAAKPPQGPFSGVPFLVKDNTPVEGLPTGHGTAAVLPVPEKKHGPVTEQLLSAGFINLGKSTLPEFGFSASTEFAHKPPTRNPWDPAYSAGASSGGSAALVAAGAIPIAHANDGGGSIRIPAAACGLVGLKPTRGRHRDGAAAESLPVNIVSEGVVTRSVRDTAAFWAAMEAVDPAPHLPRIGHVQRASRRPLRIALVTESINGHPTDAETRNAVDKTARTLAGLGHHIVPMEAPVNRHFPEDFARYWALLAFSVRAAGKRVIDPSFNRHRVDNLTRGLDRKFKREMWRLPATLWRLKRSARQYREGIQGYDAVLTPTLGHTTPTIGHLSPTLDFDTLFGRLQQYVSFTPLANATGAPAISLPTGRTSKGLPIGVQLMADHGQERILLELAYALEEADPWPLICD